nr:hypothetical protein [Tanacetum cinerariifolium]
MDMTIDQQVALNEALVPHVSRLRIGKSNFFLRSDIASKESTLQLATATVHHHSIRFKMDNRKRIVNLEYFREMMHICPRLTGQTFDELPFKEEILAFLRFLGHSGEIRKLTDGMYYKKNVDFAYLLWEDFVYQVEHKDAKKSNEMYYPRNSKAYKEYYAVASGVIPPKTKASVRKTKSSFDTTITPPTAAVMTEAEQMKLATKRSLQQTHISQDSSSGADEGTGIDSLFETPPQMDVPTSTTLVTFTLTLPTLPPLTILTSSQVQQAPTPPTTAPSTLLQDLPNFGSFRDEAQAKNKEFVKNLDENIQKIIKDQVKEQVKVQVSKILPKIEKTVNEQLEAKFLTRSSNSSKTSYAVAAGLSEMELKNILIEKMESNKSIHRYDEQRNLYKALVKAYESDKIILDTYGDTVTLKRRSDDADKDEKPPLDRTGEEPMQTTQDLEEPSHQEFKIGAADDQPIAEASQHPEWFQQQMKPPTPDRTWNKTLPAIHGTIQPWISNLAKQADSCSSFNELMDTPVDFSAFLMNRLKVDTLTLELLAGLTYEMMKGSCRRVIPFDHFINNDLEYLHGGASSRKYTTSVTKTKEADYGHIKWIEELVPRTMWSQEPVSYDKHALWRISHWRKRQQFYEFAVNRESARDVYSKHRIIAITELQIVEWHNYKHLDCITVRRDDDKLYTFKEGDFKRLPIQDIEDMLLLLVHGKLTNLTVEERFAFNVSLRMFTRSIVIQQRVEDILLGVESYQKKINLIKPDTYRFDLKHKETYTAYSNPRGFIYQNKHKQNRLMRIDEFHKFSDGTLNDVRTALDDHLKGIRMKYLPQAI